MERRVYAVDVEHGKTQAIGNDHGLAIKSVVHHAGTSSVISGSWDKTLQQTDTRAMSGESRSYQLPAKLFTMDATDRHLVVGMADRLVYIYDLRNMDAGPIQKRESSLKYPTRTLSCIPGEVGYACTSIEGRVAVEFFDTSERVQAQKYAFKCHRIVDRSGAPNAVDTVTPVNALAFHPNYDTFFSGGSDAFVCMWDYKARKRMKQYQRFPASVMALDVDSSGQMLAIGVSDDSYKENPVELGPRPAQSAVFVRYFGAKEAQGKV